MNTHKRTIANPMKKRKISRRVALFTLIVSGSILGMGIWSGHHAQASNSFDLHKKHYVTVLPGQSLWNIAQQIVKPNEDIRDVVYRLTRINHLSSSLITPGMKLLVPSKND
ncbi:LysM peptidoglycan-binding domain-containing protein [Fodinisporobacter ferrooxydans]|uniref:LysM peptidoglycan-binding domain-containing protein n=1 Tax=Fodinisporobacter ferrooxydans TaxID=2901836 RepID=A0ABY4CG82_9BACL|nr:LysM peptidoglycan-binding domain-containing protein [Alicyclobacillaceae bacterium MYW30-H2]